MASIVASAAAVVSTSSAPTPLMVPANTSSPGCFSTGRLSPVIGAWFSVERPASTRPSSGMRSPGRTATRDPTGTSEGWTSRSPVRRHEARGRRREIEELGDRPPRPADAPGLEREREREQEGHGRRLEPLADHDGAADGDRHQQVHVGPEPPKGQPCLGCHGDEPGEHGNGVDQSGGQRDRVPAAHALTPERRTEAACQGGVKQESGDGRGTGDDGRRGGAAAADGRCCRRRLRPARARPPRPAFRDRGDDRRVGNGLHVRRDGHPAAQEIEAEPRFAADDRTDLPAKRRDLFGTVHAGDAKRARLLRGHPRPPPRCECEGRARHRRRRSCHLRVGRCVPRRRSRRRLAPT